jgi:hypothetical protein
MLEGKANRFTLLLVESFEESAYERFAGGFTEALRAGEHGSAGQSRGGAGGGKRGAGFEKVAAG